MSVRTPEEVLISLCFRERNVYVGGDLSEKLKMYFCIIFDNKNLLN